MFYKLFYPLANQMTQWRSRCCQLQMNHAVELLPFLPHFPPDVISLSKSQGRSTTVTSLSVEVYMT